MGLIYCAECGSQVSDKAINCIKCGNPIKKTIHSINKSSETNTVNTKKVDMFIMSSSKFFESHQINIIRDRLDSVDDSKWAMLSTVELKDPTTTLIISLFFGGLGIDRFMIGDIGLGIGKLLTCGGMGIWTIVDWFLIQKATREKNMEKIQFYLY